MRKIILQGTQAREALAKGAKAMFDLVSGTLGPHGYNVFLDKGKRPTNDGIKIANEVQLQDEVANLGASAIREAGTKTNDEVGDGTTTAITLAYKIYETVNRFLAKEGVIGKKTPAELVKQVEKERLEITEKLQAMATPIETKEQLISSAIVSVEDTELGTLIGTAQWDIGKDGYLLAEETAERTSSVERIKGVRIDNGFGTSQVINNQEKQTLEVEDTDVLLTSITIKTFADWQYIMKLYEALIKKGGRNLVIIARAWTDETVSWCLQNINKSGACVYPLSAPYVDMQERMKDLQSVLGGTFYDSENSTLDDIQIGGLGKAKRIVARRFDAIITGTDDMLTQDRVSKRVDELKQKREGSQSDFEKKTLTERIAQLENGFGIIKVGSSSDMERKRLFDKCEDAVNAVRAAYQEGTVEGAGLAFKTISDTLPDDYLLKRPLCSIYEQIVSTSPADFVIEPWVRDPVKVLRVALEKACSTAGAFASAGGAISQQNPKELDELLGRLKPNE